MAAYFEGLADIVEPEEVRLSGGWAERSRRRYASPDQAGSGEGPFVDVVDWVWEGTFDGTSSLAGLALLVTDEGFYWVKSHPPSARPPVSFTMSGWALGSGSVMATGSFHGAYLPAIPVEIDEAPPAECVLGESSVKVGTPHVVAEVEGVALVVVVLPASAIKVGRNRLWHLRESIAGRLGPQRAALLTRGRSGRVELGSGA